MQQTAVYANNIVGNIDRCCDLHSNGRSTLNPTASQMATRTNMNGRNTTVDGAQGLVNLAAI